MAGGYCKDCANGEPYKGSIYCNYYKHSYNEYDDCGGRHFVSKSGSSRSCYITTACVDAMGKADGCQELQLIRELRDKYLAAQSGGKEEIEDYYRFAPMILDGIAHSANSRKILEGVYHDLVEPVVHEIETGKYEDAVHLYKDYVNRLKKIYT